MFVKKDILMSPACDKNKEGLCETMSCSIKVIASCVFSLGIDYLLLSQNFIIKFIGLFNISSRGRQIIVFEH